MIMFLISAAMTVFLLLLLCSFVDRYRSGGRSPDGGFGFPRTGSQPVSDAAAPSTGLARVAGEDHRYPSAISRIGYRF